MNDVMKKIQVKYWIPAFAGMTMLAGCGGIGQGSTLQTLEVRPGTGSTLASGSAYTLYECVRDKLAVIGTFTDGTAADFSFRAKWTSSDPAVVEVSNGEIENPFISEGVFTTSPNFNLQPGTLIPHAIGSATITAEFLGKRAPLDVVVGTASYVISPAPDITLTSPQPTHLGTGTIQRFSMLISRGGKLDLASALNQLGPINPLLWRFSETGLPPGSTVAFVARNPDDAADFDKYTVSNGTDVIASVNVLSGSVTGAKADSNSYPIEAQLSLCTGTPPNPIPTAAIRVANFATTAPLVVAREAGFGNGDLAANTNQLLTATANLDPNGDGSVIVTQNLTSQSRFNLEPKNATDSCDAEGLNCTLNKDLFFSSLTNDLRTIAATTGGSADAQACFPSCVPTLASLEVDNPTPAIGATAAFTASALNLTPDISATSYTFDFGDGSVPVTQADPTATHSYSADGLYTATVRVTDTSGALAQNAGAVQIRVGSAAAGNTAPTAVLAAFPLSGAAPLSVGFSAASSRDPDTGDEVAVYEFDFGDGAVLRQSTPAANHVYLTQPATEPVVTAIDKSGVRSAPAFVTVTVAGTVPATRFVRSNTLSFTAVPATLTAIAISPAAASQQAFAYPGQQFEAIGTFSATATDCSTGVCFDGNATTAAQKITRFVGWAARPAADSTAFSDIAFVRTFNDDFLHIGQVGYFQNVSANTDVFITATSPVTPLVSVTAPAPVTLTVTPCPAETCAP